jgi:hypothetical protein
MNGWNPVWAVAGIYSIPEVDRGGRGASRDAGATREARRDSPPVSE